MVDAYLAMVCDRPYRPARPSAEALAELEQHAGRQFDPVIVEQFIAVIRNAQVSEEFCQARGT